jgi:hypothetical protein
MSYRSITNLQIGLYDYLERCWILPVSMDKQGCVIHKLQDRRVTYALGSLWSTNVY